MTDSKKKDKAQPQTKTKGKIEAEPPIEEIGPKAKLIPLMSEIIAKRVIATLISYVNTEIERKKISKAIGDHCYLFTKHLTNHSLSSYHLAYDEDDYAKSLIPQRKPFEVCFNNKKEANNTWVEINMPTRVKRDRIASTLINYIKPPQLNNSEIIENEIEQMQSPLAINKQSPSLKDLDSTVLRQVQTKSEPFLLDVSHQTVSSNQSIKKRPMGLSTMKLSRTVKTIFPAEGTEVKAKDLNVIDIPNSDIPNIEAEYFPEREEDNQLRKDIEMIMKKKVTLNEIKEQKKPVKEYKLVNSNRKLMNGDRYTFDSNGKLMQYKYINPEVLSKEFWWNKPEIKDLATVDNSLVPNRYVPYKHILQRSEFQAQQYSVPKQMIVEFNNEESNPYAKNNNPVVKRPPGASYVPSGSCFKLIAPETGVVIKEDNLIKEGDNDFAKKYNKTSIETYSKLISQSNIYNSLKTKRGLVEMSNPQSLSSKNDITDQSYLGYKDNIKSSNNPLIQNEDQANITPEPSLASSYPIIPPQSITTQVNPLMSNSKQESDYQSGIIVNEKIRALFDLPYPNQSEKREKVDKSASLGALPRKKEKELVKSLSTKLFQGNYNSKLLLKTPKALQENNRFLLVNSFNQNIIVNKSKWGLEPIDNLMKHVDVNDLYKNRVDRSIGKANLLKKKKYFHSSNNL